MRKAIQLLVSALILGMVPACDSSDKKSSARKKSSAKKTDNSAKKTDSSAKTNGSAKKTAKEPNNEKIEFPEIVKLTKDDLLGTWKVTEKRKPIVWTRLGLFSLVKEGKPHIDAIQFEKDRGRAVTDKRGVWFSYKIGENGALRLDYSKDNGAGIVPTPMIALRAFVKGNQLILKADDGGGTEVYKKE